MKNGKILPSQFTTDKGEISVVSVLFFGLTITVIFYQLSFYQRWIKAMEENQDLERRVDILEKQNLKNKLKGF